MQKVNQIELNPQLLARLKAHAQCHGWTTEQTLEVAVRVWLELVEGRVVCQMDDEDDSEARVVGLQARWN